MAEKPLYANSIADAIVTEFGRNIESSREAALALQKLYHEIAEVLDSKDLTHSFLTESVKLLNERMALFENAIRRHRDQRGDDRCWLDDEELYKMLPEGYTPPERDASVELELCRKFIQCRHNPGTEYVSPQREIERLAEEEGNYERLTAHIEKLFRDRYPTAHSTAELTDWAHYTITKLERKLAWCASHASMGLVRGGEGPALEFLRDIQNRAEKD